jgi:hypothetical protein
MKETRKNIGGVLNIVIVHQPQNILEDFYIQKNRIFYERILMMLLVGQVLEMVIGILIHVTNIYYLKDGTLFFMVR